MPSSPPPSTRDETLAAMGEATLSRPPRLREGVVFVAPHQTDVLLVTVDTTERDLSPSTMYRDDPMSPRLFHWESQSTASERRGRPADPSDGGAVAGQRLPALHGAPAAEPRRQAADEGQRADRTGGGGLLGGAGRGRQRSRAGAHRTGAPPVWRRCAPLQAMEPPPVPGRFSVFGGQSRRRRIRASTSHTTKSQAVGVRRNTWILRRGGHARGGAHDSRDLTFRTRDGSPGVDVERRGFEPRTSAVRGQRSPS
jgi:hypothetical protein